VTISLARRVLRRYQRQVRGSSNDWYLFEDAWTEIEAYPGKIKAYAGEYAKVIAATEKVQELLKSPPIARAIKADKSFLAGVQELAKDADSLIEDLRKFDKAYYKTVEEARVFLKENPKGKFEFKSLRNGPLIGRVAKVVKLERDSTNGETFWIPGVWEEANDLLNSATLKAINRMVENIENPEDFLGWFSEALDALKDADKTVMDHARDGED